MDWVDLLVNGYMLLSVSFALDYSPNNEGCWQKINALKFKTRADQMFLNAMYLKQHKSCLYKHVQGYGVVKERKRGLEFKKAKEVCAKYRGRRLWITDQDTLDFFGTSRYLGPLFEDNKQQGTDDVWKDYLWTDLQFLSPQMVDTNAMLNFQVSMDDGTTVSVQAFDPYTTGVSKEWCKQHGMCRELGVVLGSYRPDQALVPKFQWLLARFAPPVIGFRPDKGIERLVTRPFQPPFVQGVICEIVTCPKYRIPQNQTLTGVSDFGDGEQHNDGLSFAGQIIKLECKAGYITTADPPTYRVTCSWDGSWTMGPKDPNFRCKSIPTRPPVPPEMVTVIVPGPPPTTTTTSTQSTTLAITTKAPKSYTLVYVLVILAAVGYLLLLGLTMAGSAHKKRKHRNRARSRGSGSGSGRSLSARHKF